MLEGKKKSTSTPPKRSMATQMTNERPTIEEPSKLMERLLEGVPEDKYDCNPTANVPFYDLPPLIGFVGHDFTRTKAPVARILGKARGPSSYDDNPGPGSYNTTGTTRYGTATSFKAKLLSRPRNLELEREVPGPGAYFPNIAVTKEALPRPVLVGRPRVVKHDENTPGPGEYAAEPAMGTNLPRLPNTTAASIKSRPRQLGVYSDAGPGPGKYTYDLNKFVKKPPAAPLGGRGADLVVAEDGPGPCAYYPKTNSYKRRAPAYSFGGKPSKCMTVVIEEDDNEHYVEYECK